MSYCYYLIVAFVIIFDRIIKLLVLNGMEPGETIPVIAGVFHLTYVQNQGAAFSLMQGQWLVLIALPAVAIAIGLVLIFLKRKTWNKLLLTAVSIICGGGLGNLIDRATAGYVVDLFDFRIFPVFNIADIFICIGCGLLLIDVIFPKRKKNGNEC